jgi:hypothetical protein
MCSQLKTPEEKHIIKLCPFSFVDLLRVLKSPNVPPAEDTEEQKIIKLFPFSFVDLLRALESPNVQSAEDTSGAADY